MGASLRAGLRGEGAQSMTCAVGGGHLREATAIDRGSNGSSCPSLCLPSHPCSIFLLSCPGISYHPVCWILFSFCWSSSLCAMWGRSPAPRSTVESGPFPCTWEHCGVCSAGLGPGPGSWRVGQTHRDSIQMEASSHQPPCPPLAWAPWGLSIQPQC